MDAAGRPLPGAGVEWTGAGLFVRADSAGRFDFAAMVSPAAAAREAEPAGLLALPEGRPPGGHGLVEAGAGTAWSLAGTRLTIGLDRGAAVSLERIDAMGRAERVGAPMACGTGTHVLDLEALAGRAPDPGVSWYRVRAGREARWLRLASGGGGWGHVRVTLGGRGPGGRVPADARTDGDSLRFSLEGYMRRALPVRAEEHGAALDVALEAGLDFAAVHAGNGVIPDIATGRMIRLPPDRRIQVILAAEGYTREDHAAGRFRRDVETWARDVFALEPVGDFREAFTVWAWPAPSPSRLPLPGKPDPGDSPFALKVSAGKVAPPDREVARRVWDLMDRLPHKPWGWYGPGGLTHRQARNVVVQILALDPARGRAGYSGLARRMAHPSDDRRTVEVAIGQEQQHEFMHALANLLDEYHDTARASVGEFTLREGSPWFTNVSASRDCGKVAWRHLLPGGPFNPGVEGLVGAFGAGGRYHPELKCLMNGTHHNAALYGGDGYLRLRRRLCNLCREIALFRIYERAGVLPEASESLEVWRRAYREAFYRRFPFHAPESLPQRNSAGTGVFMECRE
jgi:hypothetical protein